MKKKWNFNKNLKLKLKETTNDTINQRYCELE